MDNVSPIRSTPTASLAPVIAPSAGAPAPAARSSQDTVQVSSEAKAKLAVEQADKSAIQADAAKAPGQNPLKSLGV